MSQNDRKQLAIITMLTAFAQRDYFGYSSKDIELIGEHGVETFSKITTLTQSDYKSFVRMFEAIEAELIHRDYIRSSTMMLSIVLALADHFSLHVVNSDKLRIWESFNDLCISNLAKNCQALEDEVDKAIEVVDLLLNYEI